MAMRVLATQTAERAARDLRGTLQQLHADTQRVLNLGNRLADTEVWDGPQAVEFRQVYWPEARASLQPALQALERLQSSAETVVDDILKAGGDGPGGGTPSGGDSGNSLTDRIDWIKSHFMDPPLVGWNTLVGEPFRIRAGLNVASAWRGLQSIDREMASRWQEINYLQLLADRGEIPREVANARAESLLNARDAARVLSQGDLSKAWDALKSGGLQEGSKLAKVDKFLGPLNLAGDAWTFTHPSADALGGPNVEKWMAAADGAATLTTLAGVDVALGPIPGVGEVALAGTALYFAGDLIYEHREWIGHVAESAGSDVAHVSEDVASTAWKGVQSGWHAFTSIF